MQLNGEITTEKLNKSASANLGASDVQNTEWKPLSRTSNERKEELERLAEERAMRTRYAEEFRSKLRGQSSEATETDSDNEEDKAEKGHDHDSINTDEFLAKRREDTEKRFSKAEEKLKTIAESSKNASSNVEIKNSHGSIIRPNDKQFDSFNTQKEDTAPIEIEEDKEELKEGAESEERESFIIDKNYSGYAAGRITLPGADFVITHSPTPQSPPRVDFYEKNLDESSNDFTPFVPIAKMRKETIQKAKSAEFQPKEDFNIGEAAFLCANAAAAISHDREWQEYSPKSAKRVEFSGGEENDIADTHHEVNYGRVPQYDGYAHPVGAESDIADTHHEVNYGRVPQYDGYAHPVGAENDIADTHHEVNYGRVPQYDGYAHPVGAENDIADTYHEVNYGRVPQYDGYAHPVGTENDIADTHHEVNYGDTRVNFDYFGRYDYSDDTSLHVNDPHDLAHNHAYDVEYSRNHTGYNPDFDYTHDVDHESDLNSASHISYVSVEDGMLPEYEKMGRHDSRLVEEEYLRFLKDSEKRDAQLHRQKSDPYRRSPEEKSEGAFSIISRSKEAVSCRMEYYLRSLEYKWQMNMLTFGANDYKTEKEARKNVRILEKIKRNKIRALTLDEKASSRYCSVLRKCAESGGAYDNKKLDYIRTRIESLLSERDDVNTQLIELYKNSSYAKGSRVGRKAIRIRISTAKKVYRSQRSIARRLERLHAPSGLKEKIYKLMNDKTKAYSTIEYSKYILRRKEPVGDARRELKRDIKQAKKTVRFITQDIEHLFKEASKHHQRYRNNIKQGLWVIGVLALLGIGYLVFRYFDFIKGLFL